MISIQGHYHYKLQCGNIIPGVSILAVARSLEECDGDDPLSRAAPAKQQVHKDVNVLTTCVLASYKVSGNELNPMDVALF